MSKLRTINIKGKEYVTVSERVRYFREAFDGHSIITSIVEKSQEMVLMRAVVKNKAGEIVATGHASEEKKGNINMTSMIENCETSAVGRALGFFGIGVDTAVASADEMQIKLERQKEFGGINEYPILKDATHDQIIEALNEFKMVCENNGVQPSEFFTFKKQAQESIEDKYKSARMWLKGNRDDFETQLQNFKAFSESGEEAPAYMEE